MSGPGGYNGHARKCECPACVKRRVNEYLERIQDTSRMVPQSAQHTVAVRAHWRLNPRHLTKQPKYKEALAMSLSRLIKKNGGDP